MRRKTHLWLAAWLAKDYQHRVASNIDYERHKDTLRQRQNQQEQLARQFRLKQLFTQTQEREQEQRMLQQRQQEQQRKAQQREACLGELGEHWRLEKQVRLEFDAIVQHLRPEWELKPEPPKEREKKLRFVRTSVRPARP